MDGRSWPLISIVTPNLNQAKFLEETIRSVLLQGYSNLEYIIIDGGSTDGSVDIIRKYEPWLTYWVSEPDQGQASAINKGFLNARGEIWAFINSDDFYEPNALADVASVFMEHPDTDLLAGECLIFGPGNAKRVFNPAWPQSLDYFVSKTYSSTFAQPAAFWTRSAYVRAGGFSEDLHYCFDREFFLRLGLDGVTPVLLQQRLARFREHGESKTMRNGIGFNREALTVLEKHAAACGVPAIRKRLISKAINIDLRYLRIFEKWNEKGRIPALMEFMKMISVYPSSLRQRKVLGQARRLLFFPASKVVELK